MTTLGGRIALLSSEGRSLVTIVQSQLSQNVADVVLDGTLTDKETLRNLSVGLHLDEHSQHLPFPVR